MGFDFIVIGGGMAGASVAAQLAEHASVLLLEREEMPGHHTTGRSAALFTENYGNDAIRRLTSASRSFLDSPPDGFTDLALLTPRGCLYVARNGEGERLHELARESGSGAELVDAKRVRQLVPIIRSEVVEGGLMEAGASDIEVNALHHGYLRRVKALGGRMLTGADVLSIAPASNGWIVTTSQGRHHGSILINAAGAWADHIGALAGAAPIGLRPLRRTAAIVAPPPGVKVERWPAVIDAAETFYFKPEGGKILVSPADETLSDPCDAQADELDIAIGIDRVQQIADLPVRRVESAWAGLRSFVHDRTPVVGFDEEVTGFFWLAGQGGYGIQTAPALARASAALALGRDLPQDLRAIGLTPDLLGPARLRARLPA